MSGTDHGQKLAAKLLAANLQSNTNLGIWKSNSIVIKRLIDDAPEMRCVWNELWKKTNDEKQFKRVLDLIIDIAAGWGPEQQKEHRREAKRFSELNVEINLTAKKLGNLISKQREISEIQSIAGRVDHNLMDFIVCWAEGMHIFEEESDRAGRFNKFVLPELARIRKEYWSNSYWPSLIDLLGSIEAAALKNYQESMDELDLAALASREFSKLGFLRALLKALDEDKKQDLIPEKFSFTNNSLAKLFNCALGLVEDAYSEAAIKKAVQRIRKEQA